MQTVSLIFPRKQDWHYMQVISIYRKQDLTFHADCLHSEKRIRHFMQIVSIPTICMKYQILFYIMETICMKCQILFSGKNKKNISECYLLYILPNVLSIKIMQTVSAWNSGDTGGQIGNTQKQAINSCNHCSYFALTSVCFDYQFARWLLSEAQTLSF